MQLIKYLNAIEAVCDVAKFFESGRPPTNCSLISLIPGSPQFMHSHLVVPSDEPTPYTNKNKPGPKKMKTQPFQNNVLALSHSLSYLLPNKIPYLRLSFGSILRLTLGSLPHDL